MYIYITFLSTLISIDRNVHQKTESDCNTDKMIILTVVVVMMMTTTGDEDDDVVDDSDNDTDTQNDDLMR